MTENQSVIETNKKVFDFNENLFQNNMSLKNIYRNVLDLNKGFREKLRKIMESLI
jgi:hypothetical protein